MKKKARKIKGNKVFKGKIKIKIKIKIKYKIKEEWKSKCSGR
jgi:hypothetical protein